MRSLLSQMIYGGKDPDGDGNDPGTDAQPPPPAPAAPQPEVDTSSSPPSSEAPELTNDTIDDDGGGQISYLSLLNFEDDNDDDADNDGGDENNNNHYDGHVFLTQHSQNSPMSHSSPNNNNNSFYQDAQSPNALNLSQESFLHFSATGSTASSQQKHEDATPIRKQSSIHHHEGGGSIDDDNNNGISPPTGSGTKSRSGGSGHRSRNRGMSYQSEVYYAGMMEKSPQDISSRPSPGDDYINQMIYGNPDHYDDDEEEAEENDKSNNNKNNNEVVNRKLSFQEDSGTPGGGGDGTKGGSKKREWQDELQQLYDGDENEQAENVNEIVRNTLKALYTGNATDATTTTTATFRNPLLTYMEEGIHDETKMSSKKDAEDDNKDGDENLTEEQQADLRLKKELKALRKARQFEWNIFRDRWKKRKYDLRQEDDVGDAYLLRARKAMEPKLVQEKEQEQQKQQSQEDKDEEEKEETNNHHYDSEDEQVDLLQRLSQSIEQQEKLAAQEKDPVFQRRKWNQKALEEAKKPFCETMDYWQQGKTDPGTEELDFYYPRDVLPDAPLSSSSSSRKRKRGYDESSVPTTKPKILLKTKYKGPETDPNTYLHFPLHHRRFASSKFVHNRQLFRMAARCIMKATGEHDDRLLRILWQLEHGKFRHLQLLLAQTQEYGENMVTFLGHIWKNPRARKLVAQRLGIGGQRNNEFVPPPRLMGFTMEAIYVQSRGNAERQKLVERYSLQKMPATLGVVAAGAGEEQQPPWASRLAARRKRFAASSLATMSYIYLPGTTPPVPTFPLDETNLVFGPTDRHTPFRHVGGIDEATYKLTLSSLMTRLATLQQTKQQAMNHDANDNHDESEHMFFLDNPPRDHQSAEMGRLQKQLFTLVEKAPAEAKNNLYKRFPDGEEIPLVPFYRAMMAFCSFVVSGCPQPKLQEENSGENPYGMLMLDSYDEDEGASAEAMQEVSVLTMDEAAKKVYDFCDPHMKHNGLRAFPRLHLIYGLATIARLLPASAAQLLFAPFDRMENRTPFDIFRRTLEHLEEESILIEDDKMNDWTYDLVGVGELEYALHKAVEIFGLCIQRDPIEVRYHEWRLGALGASLLLCSGQSPGSRALPFPSSHYMRQGIAHANSRKTLDSFHQVRRATVQAFNLLVQLTQQQESLSRAHLAVSSFWEWTQVVALVAGRSCLNSTRLKDISSSHLYHTVQWASQEGSTDGLRYLEILTRSDPNNYDLRLKQFAAAVERDPNNVESWRSLVAELGPLGYFTAHNKDHLFCDANVCKECQLLRDGFAGQHYSVEARKKDGSWWGKDLIGWWYPHFLSTSLQVPDKSKTPQLMKKVEDTLCGLVEANESMMTPNDTTRVRNSSHPIPTAPADLAWLWTRKDEDDSDYVYPDEDQPSSIEVLLPKQIAEVIHRETNGTASAPVSDASMGPEVEAIYTKLVVTCHLFGVHHPYSVEPIYELCRRSVKSRDQTACVEWHCLMELSRLGLDLVKVVRVYQATTLAEQERKKSKRPTKPRFSEAQREAVRDGLDRFGYGKWIEMSRHYDVLDGLSRFVILDIYRWLREWEGMGDRRAEKPP